MPTTWDWVRIPPFHYFPITSSHFKLKTLGCIRNGSSQAGKSYELERAKAKSPVFILNSCQVT